MSATTDWNLPTEPFESLTVPMPKGSPFGLHYFRHPVATIRLIELKILEACSTALKHLAIGDDQKVRFRITTIDILDVAIDAVVSMIDAATLLSQLRKTLIDMSQVKTEAEATADGAAEDQESAVSVVVVLVILVTS